VSDDPERDSGLVKRLAEPHAEEAAILAELARLDPAFTASRN
jgi:hypothetical protein